MLFKTKQTRNERKLKSFCFNYSVFPSYFYAEIRRKKFRKELEMVDFVSLTNRILLSHLSNSWIFFSLSFFSFSISLRISRSRSTSDCAFPASSLHRVTSCSRDEMRSVSSVLAWDSAAALWAWNRKLLLKINQALAFKMSGPPFDQNNTRPRINVLGLMWELGGETDTSSGD